MILLAFFLVLALRVRSRDVLEILLDTTEVFVALGSVNQRMVLPLATVFTARLILSKLTGRDSVTRLQTLETKTTFPNNFVLVVGWQILELTTDPDPMRPFAGVAERCRLGFRLRPFSLRSLGC